MRSIISCQIRIVGGLKRSVSKPDLYLQPRLVLAQMNRGDELMVHNFGEGVLDARIC